MVINTSQDYDAYVGSCCTCPLPQCEEPRLECKSAIKYVCGSKIATLNLVNGDTVPCIDAHTKYKNISLLITNDGEGIPNYSESTIYSRDNNGNCTVTQTDNGESRPLLYSPRYISTGVVTASAIDAGTKYTGTFTYTNPDTKESLEEAMSNLPLSAYSGSSCSSELLHATHTTTLSTCSIFDGLRKSRYRYGVPTTYLSVSANRSRYELQWDEVFFPTTGNPTLIESRSWIWDGNISSPWSEWFESNTPTDKGVVRNVNLMAKCYSSTRIGVKPTSFGEIYELE